MIRCPPHLWVADNSIVAEFICRDCGKEWLEPSKEEESSTDNPMHYCFSCTKYLGFRGFCDKQCHNNYYDEIHDNFNTQKFPNGEIK